VALFQDQSISTDEKSNWGAVLVSIIVITILGTIGAVVFDKLKKTSEIIVNLPVEQVEKLNDEQKRLVHQMMFNFRLHQHIPADLPLKNAKQMLDPATFNKLWRWRNLGKTSKSPLTLQMTVGVQRQV
jgi:hypothetical protein